MRLTEEEILAICETERAFSCHCGYCQNNSKFNNWGSKVLHTESNSQDRLDCTILFQCPICKQYTIFIFEIQDICGEYVVHYTYFCKRLHVFNILTKSIETYGDCHNIRIHSIVRSAIKNFLTYLCYKYKPQLLRRLDVADTSTAEVNFNVNALLEYASRYTEAEYKFLRFTPELSTLCNSANRHNIDSYITSILFDPEILNLQEYVEVEQ